MAQDQKPIDLMGYAALAQDAMRGVDFSRDRRAYEQLLSEGGRLNPDRNSRAQPPGFEPMPTTETAPAPSTPGA